MEWYSLIFICLISAVLVVFLKQYKPEFSLILSLITCAVIFICALNLLIPVINQIKKMIEKSAISSQSIKILIKTTGICYLTQFISESCKDAGQNSISLKVELIGRIAVCVSALPLYMQVIQLIEKILEGI